MDKSLFKLIFRHCSGLVKAFSLESLELGQKLRLDDAIRDEELVMNK